MSNSTATIGVPVDHHTKLTFLLPPVHDGERPSVLNGLSSGGFTKSLFRRHPYVVEAKEPRSIPQNVWHSVHSEKMTLRGCHSEMM